jgi:hypothetical protein
MDGYRLNKDWMMGYKLNNEIQIGEGDIDRTNLWILIQILNYTFKIYEDHCFFKTFIASDTFLYSLPKT